MFLPASASQLHQQRLLVLLYCTLTMNRPLVLSDTSATSTSVTVVPLFLAALIPTSRIRSKLCSTWQTTVLFEISVTLVLYLSLRPHPSIVPWWGSITLLCSQWHRIDVLNRNIPWLRTLKQGPLGNGAYKVVQVLVAIPLWRLCKKSWPPIQWGPFSQHPIAWLFILLLALAVNGVLYTWSRVTSSRGTHQGVDHMVRPSLQRSLTTKETIHYAMLALVNAVCEEVTSRWFWWQEFDDIFNQAKNNNHSNNKIHRNVVTNVAQAAVFGMWHYHGIPSGMTGVALTFVYGWIMGVLKEQLGGGGLLLPVLAHTVADYYIFTTIARGKATRCNVDEKSK
jgi:Type II CAAX prenyl endopeptidase Rce1-like